LRVERGGQLEDSCVEREFKLKGRRKQANVSTGVMEVEGRM